MTGFNNDHEKMDEKKVDEENGLHAVNSQRRASFSDAVFGEITEEGPNYRAVGWKGTTVLMLKTQIGLGVLSIPQVFHSLGLVPGVICLLIIAVMTSWSNYIVGVFKIRHPDVYGIDDVGRKLFGRIGYEFFGITFALYWIFVAGSGMLGIATALNALSSHGACTAVFVAVATIVGFSLGSIQTLGRISWLAWIGVVSILVAILTLTVSVGVQERPAAAPITPGPWKSDYAITQKPKPAEAFAALSSLVFAYAGTPAFFNIVSEMREPRHYTRALILCQSIMTAVYIAIGVVVYYFCGSYVASPALGSAGKMMKKVCYGLALPGLIVSTTLFVHFAAKYFFMRILRGSQHLTRNTKTHWITWIGCTAGNSLVAYIVASAIPVFGGLVSLVGALLGTLMCMQPMGCMWLYDHWREARTPKWMFMVGWCAFMITAGWFLTIAGTYGSIVGIMDSYKASGGSAAWTCADNSNSS
ncbi:putative amino acid transporter [Cucurbitaria berberidis CBS 394.84]|uniref:Amino acid transporter n=1 Tax=Cucurbitaria berberidis CBS 394.84 TaxID=1168544 RepID=A0A9P4G7A6_9PLEO|nr:putative amino acid transporter [Cucurbitaria berberidis CBS 394.84]KAF1840361.1 putative amino acid transporter [Cucurbitaria berberidis CBS 394.84]